MKEYDFSGYWTGEVSGTNQGSFFLNIKQAGNIVTGTVDVQEPSMGQYKLAVTGIAGEKLELKLTPISQSSGFFRLGVTHVTCEHIAKDTISGLWKSSVGTLGTVKAKKFIPEQHRPELPKSNSVFVVHGHNGEVKESVARFLTKLGLEPVILQEQINKGMTLIEKFETFASRAGFAVVVMTPDDVGYPVPKGGEIEPDKKLRPRQNVILELGYFVAKLGREKTFVLCSEGIEIPSDIMGIVYTPIDKNNGWKLALAKELQEAKFPVDLNKAI